MQNILVTLDGSGESECVLPYVAAISKAFGSRVTLLHAIHYPISGMFGEEPTDWQLIEEIENSSESWAREYLQNKQTELEALGLPVSWLVVRANPADAILDYADEKSPDLIALSTHGRSGITRMILGSVAQRVLGSCETPLLLLHPSDEEHDAIAQLNEIVVPLDTSELAEAALPLSREIAKALGMSISLVTAIPSESDLYLGIEYMVHPANLIEQAGQVASAYLTRLSGTISDEDGLETNWELLHGDAGEQIVEFSRDRTNNIVVMSTHGRTGVGRWVLGSVTDKVVRSSGDPVIVVRAPKK